MEVMWQGAGVNAPPSLLEQSSGDYGVAARHRWGARG